MLAARAACQQGKLRLHHASEVDNQFTFNRSFCEPDRSSSAISKNLTEGQGQDKFSNGKPKCAVKRFYVSKVKGQLSLAAKNAKLVEVIELVVLVGIGEPIETAGKRPHPVIPLGHVGLQVEALPEPRGAVAHLALARGNVLELSFELRGVGVPGRDGRIDVAEIPAIGLCLCISGPERGGDGEDPEKMAHAHGGSVRLT